MLAVFNPATPRSDVVLTTANDEVVTAVLVLEEVSESEPEVSPESDIYLPLAFDPTRVIDMVPEAIDNGEVIEELALELVSFWLV